jgi:hypothetical protein
MSEVYNRGRAVRNRTAVVTWPDSCPFSPKVDVFGWHEMNKSRAKDLTSGTSYLREWVCNYTGKSFKNEHYIDLHMELMFSKEMPENGVCLTDYCEVFEFCKVEEPSIMESLSSEPPPCDPIQLERLKQTCHDVIGRCFLADDPARNVTELHQAWCEPLTCPGRLVKHLQKRKEFVVFTGIAVVVIACLIALFVCFVYQTKDNDGENRSPARRPMPRGGGSIFNKHKRH